MIIIKMFKIKIGFNSLHNYIQTDNKNKNWTMEIICILKSFGFSFNKYKDR